MNPFFFGTAARPLYGVYHPPKGRGGGDIGVVLCYPIHVEYMRAHRAFRQLTSLLTRRGLHVLRFDYHGTGDSGGDESEGTLEGWTADVGSAIDELKETAGLSTVSLIGLRLGAALAARAVAGRSDVDRLILWDPVVSGEAYLTELLRRPPTGGFEGDVMGIRGYPVSRELFEGLRKLELGTEPVPADLPVDLVVPGEHPAFSGLRDAWSSPGRPVSFEVVPSDANWGEGDEFGAALIPQGIVQALVDRVARAGVS
ncbi:MAG: hypothetical protein EA350_00170 [Gemmatimonadales bacterium]|nr:MAG: hypothetical protein EA350_00170 [Gemmatimonadales bacterium]